MKIFISTLMLVIPLWGQSIALNTPMHVKLTHSKPSKAPTATQSAPKAGSQKIRFLEFRDANPVNVLKLVKTLGKIKVPKKLPSDEAITLRLENVSWNKLLQTLDKSPKAR